MQFHGQDGLGDAPSIHPALESISHSPLQGIAALKLVEVGSPCCHSHTPVSYHETASPQKHIKCRAAEPVAMFTTPKLEISGITPAIAVISALETEHCLTQEGLLQKGFYRSPDDRLTCGM